MKGTSRPDRGDFIDADLQPGRETGTCPVELGFGEQNAISASRNDVIVWPCYFLVSRVA